MKAEEWERNAVAALRKVTDRKIVYRPKPSWTGAKPIEGTSFSPRSESLNDVLRDCHAVVTHHSNTAVDALVAGVPVFCLEGVASPLALDDLASIENPVTPDGREQWAADVAWTQFSVKEMQCGLAWRHLKDEGVVP